MQPVRLKLFNFLAYRDPDPLLFDGITLACLTGANGAGKSSLLDAITFALWGRARAKGIELIHAGQSEMRVELDFTHDGHTYRVVRHMRGSASKPKMEVSLFSVLDDDTLKINNGAHQRETQKRIDELLRLDYDLFVSSAYLQQGKADSFTLMPPAERKKLLANLLGIDRWATYEARAKDARKKLDEEVLQIQGSLNIINAELAQEGPKSAELAEAQTVLEQAEAQLADTQAALDTVRDAEQRRRQVQEQMALAMQNIQRWDRDLADTQRKADGYREQILGYEATLADEDTIEAGYAQLTDIERRNETLNEALKQMRPLEARQSHLKREIGTEQAQLERDRAHVHATVTELEQQTAADHDAALAALTVQIAELEPLEAERTALQAHSRVKNTQLGEAKSHRDRLERDGKTQRQKFDVLQKLTDPICPTCGQSLTPENKEQVLNEWDAELQALRLQFNEAKTTVAEISAAIKADEQRLDDISTGLKQLPYLKQDFGKLEQQQATASEARQRLDEQQAALQMLHERLERDDYALGQRAELATIEAQLQQITYSSDDHDDLKATLNELRAYSDARRTLDDARKSLPMTQELLNTILDRSERLIADRAVADISLTELQAALPQLEEAVQRYTVLKAQQLEDTLHKEAARDHVTSLKQELKAITGKKQQRDDLVQQQDAAALGVSRYKELIAAFGKNGVPAMIIEAAIPELEELANSLLARMTNGRMHLRLVTQQANQDGSAHETLNIEIADELGTRSYDLYSGGEAFRINFALRVALSKLLARRAGAHVQTLFIDEGFGTQDEEGRARLVEAINTVQSDFDMILVITHMEDLRDAFPVHILVEKTPQGSQFALR